MIKLILRGEPYTAEEQQQIIDYCWLDTDGLAALLPRILPDILARPDGWAFALIRGLLLRPLHRAHGMTSAFRSTRHVSAVRPALG